MNKRILRTWAIIGLLVTGLGFAKDSTKQEHWISTWAASMLATNVPQGPPPGAAQPQTPPAQPGAANSSTIPFPPAQPAAAPAKPQPLRSFNNQTVRMMVRTSLGGRRIRVTLANTFGSGRLKVGAAHVALRERDAAIIPASDHALTFSGNPTTFIPTGAVVVSDPEKARLTRQVGTRKTFQKASGPRNLGGGRALLRRRNQIRWHRNRGFLWALPG